jgi:DNA-binding SARP family transcriptional activator
MRLQLDLFGPVHAWYGTEAVALGSAQRRALLAVLALRANQAVTRPELVDAIWGEVPPRSADGSIYTYVSSLRSALEPKRSPRTASRTLTSNGSGYCLHIDPEAIDVVRFENFREEAQRLSRARDSAASLRALDSALELSRKEPLQGLPGPFAETQRKRLRELRLDVVERRAQLLLDSGEHAQVAAELGEVAGSNLMREGLQSLLVVALYRSGRRIEALRVFEEVRALTIEQFGMEPGAELATRYRQVKADDPALWRDSGPVSLAGAGQARNRIERPQLFAGRTDELTILRRAVARGNGSVWIEGEPGIGKSALVAEALADVVGGGTLPRMLPDFLDNEDTREPPSPDRIVERVTALCREGPLVLVADDLQRAGTTGLAAWRRLAAETARLPLLLIGVCRPVPSRTDAGRARAELIDGGTALLALDPLLEDEARALVTELIGAAPEPALLALASTAAGNPRYLHDLTEAWKHPGSRRFRADADRPEIPAVAVPVIVGRLGFLSPPASEALRWAALLGEAFTRGELSAALGRPADELAELLEELVTAGVLIDSGDRVLFRHQVVRHAFYAKTPQAIRVALHRQLAEALADAGAPVERVAGHLLAAPTPIDVWSRDWVKRELGSLAPRSPLAAITLARRVHLSYLASESDREALSGTTTKLLFWLGHDPEAEAGQVTARTKDLGVAAEMRWFLSCSAYQRGHLSEAVAGVRKTLKDKKLPPAWRALHTALLAKMLGREIDNEEPSLLAALTIPPQWPAIGFDAGDAYRLGRWDEVLAELTRTLRSGQTVATYALAYPDAMRRLSGVAALIAGHRDRPEDAATHLSAAWAELPAGGIHAGGGDSATAASALLAERRGEDDHALALFSTMLGTRGEELCVWMPTMVRLADEQGEPDQAKDATVFCEQTPGQETASLHCRALLEADPSAALTVASRHHAAGRRLGWAQALEDAAVLLARHGRDGEALPVLETALTGYHEMGATWDARRAKQRTLPILGYPAHG